MDYTKLSKYSDLSDRKERFLYRFFEILPGGLAWGTLVLIIIGSFLVPVWMAIFIIIFDIYWLIKTVYLSFHLNHSFRKMRKNISTDWLKKLSELPTQDYQLKTVKSWQDIYHLIILPRYKESIEIVTATLEGLIRSDYPKNKMIVVLGQEERAGQQANSIKDYLEKEYGHHFFKFLITEHPADLAGELAGKGSNASFAAEQAKAQIIDRLSIPYSNIIVSNFDVDTVVPSHFFSCLTWHYLTTPDPLHASYQPVPFFVNNIWEAPAFARVFAFSTTFWQMIQQARPEQLVTFSSQSISFKALVEVGFWQRNMVSEDSRIFWQCLLHYDGNWRTVPLHYPVYMDANVAPTFWQTLKNQYKQILRWHFGAENNPYFMFGFWKNKKIPGSLKRYFIWTMGEKTHSSATNALIIFLLGWLPLLMGGSAFNQTVLSLNLPHFTRNIMLLAMLGLISSAAISVIFLPPRPPNYGRFKWVWMFLQWILFPINFIFFGAVPALDAQTRLMLGKYLGFWVTPKVRSNRSIEKDPAISYSPVTEHLENKENGNG
ncbi:MAG: glycosyltransferase family 2 protein [bacterium]|nr:glycosyltransferase family 2 protein [bacterium]